MVDTDSETNRLSREPTTQDITGPIPSLLKRDLSSSNLKGEKSKRTPTMDVPKKVIILGVLCCVALVILFNHGLSKREEHITVIVYNISQTPELTDGHVTMPSRFMVEDKMTRLMKSGKDKLHVIFDFDRTLSKYHDNATTGKTTYDIFQEMNTVPKKYKEGTGRLYAVYGPVEQDPTMSKKEKIPFMDQWVEEHAQLLKGMSMNMSLINQAVIHSNLRLRDGVNETFRLLNRSSVPVLVFSGGLGDLVNASLHLNGLDIPQLHVVSNFFKFDNGTIEGFKGEHIHAFNKDRRILERIDFKLFKKLEARENVILVGDSLGDASMADGLSRSSTILRIAFLNNQVEENLPYYEKKFDIIIKKDQSMKVVNAILRKLLT